MTFRCSKNCILPRQQQHNSNGGGGGAEDGCTATAPNHNDTDNMSSMSIIIRRICPRNVRLSKNWGVCGYDIFVHPDQWKLLFQSLIIYGGACLIGISEETYLALECDPPMLISPRDYPDTVEGIRYWNVNTTSEWNDMRHYWEGGGGRIATLRKETLTSTTVHQQRDNDDDNNNNNNNHRRLDIDWTNLLDENRRNLTDPLLHRSNAGTTKKNQPSSSTKTTIYDASGDCVHGVVVIRSQEYIEPFQMALLECTSPNSIGPSTATTLTSIPTMNSTNNFTCTKVPLRKRNHRSRTNTSATTTTRRNNNIHLVTAPRLSVSQRMAAHRSVGTIWNRTMESSSSSSEEKCDWSRSVLICTIQIIGPGTLSAGCCIYSSSPSADHPAISSTDGDDGSSSNHSDTDPYSLRQGDNDKDDFVLLGYVTTGTFSISRGHCYGIAIIGARLWLQAISNSLLRVGYHNTTTTTAVSSSSSLSSSHPILLAPASPPPTTAATAATTTHTNNTTTPTVQFQVYVPNPNCPSRFYTAALSLYHQHP
jgi:hypothetical protein